MLGKDVCAIKSTLREELLLIVPTVMFILNINDVKLNNGAITLNLHVPL